MNIYNTTQRTVANWRLFAIAMLCICLMGCNQNNDATEQLQQSDETVTLTKEDIFSTKSERYQPSYNLSGQLVPTAKRQILTLDDAIIAELLVTKGDWAEVGDPLIKLKLMSSDNSESSSHIINSQNGNGLTDNRQDHDKSDTPSLSEATPSRAPNVLPNNMPVHNSESGSSSGSGSGSGSDIESDISGNNEASDNDDKTVNDDARNVNSGADSKDDNQQLERSDTNDDTQHKKREQDTADASLEDQYLTVEAQKAGEVLDIFVSSQQQVNKDEPLMLLADTRQLQLIGELPLETEPQLAVGHAVNFTVLDIHQKFTGQISKFETNEAGDKLLVYALVNQSQDAQTHLEVGMQANMSINYGQIEVGMLLPRRGIHGVDLSGLNTKHTRPVSPLHGYVWVIEQDQHLTRQPIEVVQYYPDSDQFLVAGINNDSLVCLADLAEGSENKIAIVR